MKEIEEYLSSISGAILADQTPKMNISVILNVKGPDQLEWQFSNCTDHDRHNAIAIQGDDIKRLMNKQTTFQQLFLNGLVTVSGDVEQVQYLTTWF